MTDARVDAPPLDGAAVGVATVVAVVCPGTAVAVGFGLDDDVQPATVKANIITNTARIAGYLIFIISLLLH
jgi:hypothetical protein